MSQIVHFLSPQKNSDFIKMGCILWSVECKMDLKVRSSHAIFSLVKEFIDVLQNSGLVETNLWDFLLLACLWTSATGVEFGGTHVRRNQLGVCCVCLVALFSI